MNTPPPDVAAILTHLREEVRARRQASASGERSAARTALERELQQCLEQIEITRVVNSHWPLVGRNILERGWFMVHRLVRRYLHWYINPIVDQQNAFNDVTARTLRLLVEAYSDLYTHVDALERAQDARNETPGRDGDMSAPVPRQTTRNDLPLPDDDPSALSALPTETLQSLVEQRGQTEPPASFPDVALRQFPRYFALHQAVNAHLPLEGDTPIRKVATGVQKTIRFYLRWLINPIVEQQNACNAAVSAAIPPMIATDAELRAVLAALRLNMDRTA